LAGRLFALAAGPRGRAVATRRDVAELLRRCSPFIEESLSFLLAAGDQRVRDLARAARRIARRPAALRRILKPVRPLSLEEIRTALRLDEGPRLGEALAALDLALAAGEIRRAPGARRWLAARRLGKRPPRLVP
jgi:hypothetical protein